MPGSYQAAPQISRQLIVERNNFYKIHSNHNIVIFYNFYKSNKIGCQRFILSKGAKITAALNQPEVQAKGGCRKDGGRSLMVQEQPIGKPHGIPQSLDSFMKDFELPEEKPHQTFTDHQLDNDPEARGSYYGQIIAAENRAVALDRIGEDKRLGLNINADDLRQLSRSDLEGHRGAWGRTFEPAP